jgi:hypothetical protein
MLCLVNFTKNSQRLLKIKINKFIPRRLIIIDVPIDLHLVKLSQIQIKSIHKWLLDKKTTLLDINWRIHLVDLIDLTLHLILQIEFLMNINIIIIFINKMRMKVYLQATKLKINLRKEQLLISIMNTQETVWI